MVGEVYLLDLDMIARYHGVDDELHLAFNFPALYTPWDAGLWRAQIEMAERRLAPAGAWPTWVLSNHDNPRHRTRYGGSEARARAAAVVLLTLRGTPFLYAGEELGLSDAEIPPTRLVDPGGRDGCRAPIPWEPGPDHGWPAEPWLPFPGQIEGRSATEQRHEPGSILHLYRDLLRVRRGSVALHEGHQSLLQTPTGVLGWSRRAVDGDERVVLVNFTATEVSLEDEPIWPSVEGQLIEIASDRRGEGRAVGPSLAPDQAVVLRRP